MGISQYSFFLQVHDQTKLKMNNNDTVTDHVILKTQESIKITNTLKNESSKKTHRKNKALQGCVFGTKVSTNPIGIP